MIIKTKFNTFTFYPKKIGPLSKGLTFFILVFFIGCKKLVSIPEPVSTITTAKVFETNDQANSAIAGIYSQMNYSLQAPNFCNGAITIFGGMSSDELNTSNSGDINYGQFQNNILQSFNFFLSLYFWTPAYSYIYQTNAAIEGLTNSKSINDSVRNVLIGEAKLLRAYCYFYLVNLFGDLPFVTTSDWNQTHLLTRSPSGLVYQQLISDLKDAQSRLPNDYRASGGERIRPNKWAATSILSRVYLYTGDYSNAEIQANLVIANSSVYSLVSDLASVFSKNSTEAIWQLQQNEAFLPFNATREGYTFSTINVTTNPSYYLTSSLLGSFETGDLRKTVWTKSTVYGGSTYYYPYKYKTGRAQAVPNGSITEYYTMLRLAELYLIRAEARARQNNLSGAISDLNIIRNRASLPNLASSLSQAQVMSAIEQERRIELFAEWGHRWLDLKRTGRADAVLGPIKGSNWQVTDQLYPIPLSEIKTDPNLIQNPGY